MTRRSSIGRTYGADVTPPSRWAAWGTLFVCAVLLCAFALLAWTSVLQKSATVDEPAHVLAGWHHLRHGDFRVNADDPPLWKFTAARPNAAADLGADSSSTLWERALDDADAWREWAREELYDRHAARADAVLARSRAAMLLWALALGALIGWWAWKLAGPVGAIVATGLFALDPNFLAHGPLVNGDVAVSLAMLAAVHEAWRLGRRVTLLRLLLLGVLLAISLAVKFSGVFVVAVVAVLVASRALVPAAWPLMGGKLRRWWGRPVVAVTVLLILALITVSVLWGVYGFRFRPAPQADSAMRFEALVRKAAIKEASVRHAGNRRLSTQPVANPSPVIRLATFAESRRLLPQAWLYGALHNYQEKLTAPAYLLEKSSRKGWWYYFPLAMAAKAPLAALLVLPLVLVALLGAWRRVRPLTEAGVWTAMCIALPVVLYLAIAMLSRTHHGLRHVLPVYPLLYVAAGVAAAAVWARRSAAGRTVVALLAFGLAFETAWAYPNYISFFNVAAQRSLGGLRLLSESNLDWGQDLPSLAKWQREHPERKLYLSYYGTADPAHYGVKATPVAGTAAMLKSGWPTDDGAVLAVSATHLQGIGILPELRPMYASLRKRDPLAVLGGSIYLFELPLKPVP